jgi:hypothetical protein
MAKTEMERITHVFSNLYNKKKKGVNVDTLRKVFKLARG